MIHYSLHFKSHLGSWLREGVFIYLETTTFNSGGKIQMLPGKIFKNKENLFFFKVYAKGGQKSWSFPNNSNNNNTPNNNLLKVKGRFQPFEALQPSSMALLISCFL